MALAKWVSALQCEDGDELLLLSAGMSRTVISRWTTEVVSDRISDWSETVSQLCQTDADTRGGVCSYDLEHRRGNDARATYRVRRISTEKGASADSTSIEGVVGMLMKHLEAREKAQQTMLSSMVSMTSATMQTLIERVQVLERERGDILVREREAMEATVVAASDIESRERLESKLYQIGDVVMARLAAPSSASEPPKQSKATAERKKNGASANKSLARASE